MHRTDIDHPLSGQELREAAGELLKKEQDSSLRRKLKSLAMDPDFEGTEQEKNLKLAVADYVSKDDDIEDIPPPHAMGEDDKRQSGPAGSEEGR